MSTTFDRVRARSADASPRLAPQADSEGRRALFSDAPQPRPATGSLVIECSRCGERSVLSPVQAVRAVVPSLHLPFLRRQYESWLRCPACRRFAWTRVRVQL